MTKAMVKRLHKPIYSLSSYPPLPTRMRLSVDTWERSWRVSFRKPLLECGALTRITERFASSSCSVSSQLLTSHDIRFSARLKNGDEQSEFELSMSVLARLQEDIGRIEKVQSRDAELWPIDQF